MRIILLTAALAGLSACDTKPTEIGPGATRTKTDEIATTPSKPVTLPPSIAASKQYRCADGSLALVDYYSDDMSASVKTTAAGTPVKIVAPAKGGTMVGGGYSLKGSKTDGNVSFSSPEHPRPQRCHV